MVDQAENFRFVSVFVYRITTGNPTANYHCELDGNDTELPFHLLVQARVVKYYT